MTPTLMPTPPMIGDVFRSPSSDYERIVRIVGIIGPGKFDAENARTGRHSKISEATLSRWTRLDRSEGGAK